MNRLDYSSLDDSKINEIVLCILNIKQHYTKHPYTCTRGCRTTAFRGKSSLQTVMFMAYETNELNVAQK